MEYIEIKEQIKQKLPVARDFGDSENLLELGLSSLTIMRLVNQWRKQGVKVSFGSLMENPTLEGWWALIQRSMKKKAGKKRVQESKITPEKDMKQPFPLTDVQYAYWVGRDEEQALGGIDCHAYLEFDAQPAIITPYTATDVIAKIYNKPAFTSANTNVASNGTTAQAANAGAMAKTGPSKNRVLFDAVGIRISLNKSFRPSASG